MTTRYACPACRAMEYRSIAGPSADVLERYRRYSERKYGGFIDKWPEFIPLEILRCGVCGHHWYPQPPSPEELAAMYAAARPLTGDSPPSAPSAMMYERMRRLRRLAPGNTLLDFGSGRGLWSAAAARAGFTVTAFEPHENRLLAPAEQVEHVQDKEALFGRTFDMILLEQVLEHVPDPMAMLEDVRAFCNPRTMLVVRVPNIERECPGSGCWAVWPFDGRRAHIMAPFEHLHGFTRKSLVAAVTNAGFELVSSGLLLTKAPTHMARRIVGGFIPRLAATEVYVHVAR